MVEGLFPPGPVGTPRLSASGDGFWADTPGPADRWTPDEIVTVLDDRTVAYVTGTRGAFAALRQSAAQLAGVLVLAAARQHRMGGVDAAHPMLALAASSLDEASDAVLGVVPPPRARHHHVHLTRAIEAIRATLREAERTRALEEAGQLEGVLGRLRAAWSDVQACSRSLPGFEIVDFNQACCAAHRPR